MKCACTRELEAKGYQVIPPSKGKKSKGRKHRKMTSKEKKAFLRRINKGRRKAGLKPIRSKR